MLRKKLPFHRLGSLLLSTKQKIPKTKRGGHLSRHWVTVLLIISPMFHFCVIAWFYQNKNYAVRSEEWRHMQLIWEAELSIAHAVYLPCWPPICLMRGRDWVPLPAECVLQLHLDAARTSMRGWGRGRAARPRHCCDFGLRRNFWRGAIVPLSNPHLIRSERRGSGSTGAVRTESWRKAR